MTQFVGPQKCDVRFEFGGNMEVDAVDIFDKMNQSSMIPSEFDANMKLKVKGGEHCMQFIKCLQEKK